MYDATKQSLTPFFEPRSVAIVGASGTPGKAGYEAIRNLQANAYPGHIYPVNPRGGEILGLPVMASIGTLPDGVDVAIIILPAEATPQAVRECASRGIGHVALMAGGFAEVDETGVEAQNELLTIIRETGIRVLGPNISGHASTPQSYTSAFFPLGKIRRGTVSVIAQTGNFLTHTMRYILTGEHFGVARVIGLGNKVDVDEVDALEYLADDPETSAIIMYLESFKRPARFLSVAREVSRRKPIVMLKSGMTEAGKQAAVAHTAAMATEDRLVDGMLRQSGIVRLEEYTDLILAAKALSMVPLPKGNRVGFLAPSGAMLVVLTDLCVRLGLEVPTVTDETVARLHEISPPYIRMRNPVDIWASATVNGVEFGYREGMEALLKDPTIDAVVPILMLTRDTGIPPFDFIVDLAQRYPEKPILVGFSGDADCMEECKAFLEPRNIPTFPVLEQPFKALAILARCHEAMLGNH